MVESTCTADAWSKKHSTTANGFCSYKVSVDTDDVTLLSQPRAIVTTRRRPTTTTTTNNHHSALFDEALVLSRGAQSILYLTWNMSLPLRTNNDKDSRRLINAKQLIQREGLNHGLAWTRSHVYASTATTVIRWSFRREEEDDDNTSDRHHHHPRLIIDGDESIVVENIYDDGSGGAPQGHTTRTLAIDNNEEYLYVSIGSYANIDKSSYRSNIRRFPLLTSQELDKTNSTMNQSSFLLPYDFRRDGELFVDGLRNEVALAFDTNNILWGIGNSGDNLFRADLGGDIHNDNPAEEVHRLQLNQHYGYPFCWREYRLETMGLGQGTAWAWPTTMENVTDQDCREQYETPVATLPAHSAPLGMTFYRYRNETTTTSIQCPGVIPFPFELDGYAFIAYHGSWNRDIPTGYKVVYMDLQAIDSVPTDLLSSAGCYAKWDDGTRPVDLAFDQCGRLWVTSDGSSRGRGSHLIVIESTSTVLLPQPPAVIPCAWRLPAWAISSVASAVMVLMGGVLWFMARKGKICTSILVRHRTSSTLDI